MTTRAPAGFYSLSWREYSDLDFDRYSFRAVDLVLQQFVPIFDKKRVFAVRDACSRHRPTRGQTRAVLPQADRRRQHEPPRLHDFRFRDDAVVDLNAEYRWEAFSASTWRCSSRLATSRPTVGQLKSAPSCRTPCGVGFRFNTYQGRLCSASTSAFGREGAQLFWKFRKAVSTPMAPGCFLRRCVPAVRVRAASWPRLRRRSELLSRRSARARPRDARTPGVRERPSSASRTTSSRTRSSGAGEQANVRAPQRQHHRRGARLELVHQPRSARGRSTAERAPSRARPSAARRRARGRSSRARATASPRASPLRDAPARSGSSRSTRRPTPRWRPAPRWSRPSSSGRSAIHVPENHLAVLSGATSSSSATRATIRDVSGQQARADPRRSSTRCCRAARAGRRHASACSPARRSPGTPVGPFRYYGTRPDDPNDIYPARASPRAARACACSRPG